MQAHGIASGHLREIKRRKGVIYYARVRLPDGTYLQRGLGPKWTAHSAPPAGYLTKKMADAQLQAMLNDANHGRLAVQQAQGVTFGDACEEYMRFIEHDRKRALSTIADYRNSIDSILLEQFGKDTPLGAVTAVDVEDFREQRVRDGRAPATINKQLRILHGIFKRAARVYGLATNPVVMVARQPFVSSGDFNVLTPNEIIGLAGAALSEQEAAIYTTAGFTGLRMGELRALRWEDVDFSKALVHVRRSFTRGHFKTPKSGRVRSVPLADPVMRVLDGLSRREFFTDPDDLVFCTEVGGVLQDYKVSHAFKRALKAAGLGELRFHDLRHSYGTIMVQAFALSDVMAYMGHADISTTMRYVHHVPKHDAATKLSTLIKESFVPPYAPPVPLPFPEPGESQ